MNFFILGLFWMTGLIAQQSPITVSCLVSECDGALSLHEFDGFRFREIQTAKNKGNDLYEFQVPSRGEPRFYYIGPKDGGSRFLPVLLGTEKNVRINGNCPNIRSAEIQGSPINEGYKELTREMNILQTQSGRLRQAFQRATTEESKMGVIREMEAIDEKKLRLLDSLKQSTPLFADILALNTYLSYPVYQSQYRNEIDYFVNEYFHFVDFADTTYRNMPWVFEAFRSFTQTLTSIGLSNSNHQAFLDKVLEKIPEGSLTEKLALGGIISILEERNHGNFVIYSQQFLDHFSDSDPETASALKEKVDRIKDFMVGGMPPDFSQQTPEGEELKLSDLRGKVVLLDFWASWCGPCRKENPNVVRVYQKYKDKGFEILGISLDRSRDNWLEAIEKDGLTWYHVSDLKGWKNEVAVIYNVTSIPQTILLDKEGRILAKNLRGEALERKLEEIFLQ